MLHRRVVRPSLLVAGLALLQLSAARAAEPANEMVLLTVRSERSIVDIVSKGAWRTLKNTDAGGAVPGVDWKTFIYFPGFVSGYFWPVKPGARISPGSSMTSGGKESPFWLQVAENKFEAMSGTFNSVVVCPDPGQGAKPDATSCLKPSEMEGVFPIDKSRLKWDQALSRLKEGTNLRTTVVAGDQRVAAVAALEASALQARQVFEEQQATQMKREQEEGQRQKAKMEGLKREFYAIPRGQALACDSTRAPKEPGSSFSETLVDCALPSRYELRMTVADVLAAGWSVESQSSSPSEMWGNRALNYSLVFRKR